MAIVPAAQTLVTKDLAVPLARYLQIIDEQECAFWGVSRLSESGQRCKIWLLGERLTVQEYLLRAQQMMQEHTRFPLVASWVSDETYPFRSNVLTLNNGRLLAVGIKASSDIQLGAIVNKAADPHTLSITNATVSTIEDVSEVVIYHPGTDNVIVPSNISISGTTLSIEIPRCRTVKTALVNNDDQGLDYTDDNNFEDTLDVKRCYTDNSTNAEYVWPHRCSTSCFQSGCSEYTHTACMTIRNGVVGSIGLLAATYSNGQWNRSTTGICCSGDPSFVRVNYKAGLEDLSKYTGLELAIVRLAHALMPAEFCPKCDLFNRLWTADHNVPKRIPAERYKNPFGFNDGAWFAWTTLQEYIDIGGYAL